MHLVETIFQLGSVFPAGFNSKNIYNCSVTCEWIAPIFLLLAYGMQHHINVVITSYEVIVQVIAGKNWEIKCAVVT